MKYSPKAFLNKKSPQVVPTYEYIDRPAANANRSLKDADPQERRLNYFKSDTILLHK